MADVEIWLTSPGGDFNLRTAYEANPPYGYAVTDPEELINAGAKIMNRNNVTSPFVDGEIQVHAVAGGSMLNMQILILQPTHVAMQVAIANLVNVLNQDIYELHIRLDTLTEYSWQLREADFGITFNRRFIHALSCIMRVTAPRRSLAIQGPV